MTGVAQVLMKDKANGSFVKENGKVVGSSLIGQSFLLKNGAPTRATSSPGRRRGRHDGYDAMSSGGIQPDGPA